MNKKEKTPMAIEVQSNDNQSLAHEKDFDIDFYLAKRKEFITKVNAIMVEGKDYHVIQGKKSLAKGGAEKIASIFGWAAEFTKDQDVTDSFNVVGLLALKCTLRRNGVEIGEGRGAATLQKNNSDPNKTVKMAQKSAFIDAVLRASGLSDFFTQDLEDMNPADLAKTIPQNSSEPYLCSEHGNTIKHYPAGVKNGKAYDAFYSCPVKINGKWCKAPLVDHDHNEVRKNPETGQMEIIQRDPVVSTAVRVFDGKIVEPTKEDLPA